MARPMKRARWTEKFLKTVKIADEPALNKQGFWKKPDFPHVKSSKTDSTK